MKKIEQEKGMETEGDVILDKMVRNGSSWEMTFEMRFEWREVVSKADIWGKSFLGSENSKCRGSETREYLAYLKNSKEATEVGSAWKRER